LPWDLDAQLALIEQISAFVDELPDEPIGDASTTRYYWTTTSGEASMLWSTTGCRTSAYTRPSRSCGRQSTERSTDSPTSSSGERLEHEEDVLATGRHKPCGELNRVKLANRPAAAEPPQLS
jgi:hypothetical protein